MMSAELEALFSSTARVEVLRLFLLNPGRQYYQREIERETGQPIRAVQREVGRMEEIGLLFRTAEGNRVFYGVNADFALLNEVTALFEKATGTERLGTAASAGEEARPEASDVEQPFSWMESPPVAATPGGLRRIQVEGEWDRGY
jgi:hypothetical protein